MTGILGHSSPRGLDKKTRTGVSFCVFHLCEYWIFTIFRLQIAMNNRDPVAVISLLRCDAWWPSVMHQMCGTCKCLKQPPTIVQDISQLVSQCNHYDECLASWLISCATHQIATGGIRLTQSIVSHQHHGQKSYTMWLTRLWVSQTSHDCLPIWDVHSSCRASLQDCSA